MKRQYTLKVGRFQVAGEFNAVPVPEGHGSWAIHNKDLERLELEAAIAVLSTAESINGDELKFARKAMDLRQTDLAVLLDVTSETVSRWETGAEPIRRQTQLAILCLVEHTRRNGAPVPLRAAGEHDPVRISA